MAKRNKRVKPDQLGPLIAEGYTDRPMTPEDARREFPVNRPPKQGVSHMHGHMVPGTRTPSPTMVLLEGDAIIEEPNTGRRFKDVKQVITKEMHGAILDGRMCLKCKEPFTDIAWPKECPVCGYEVSDRQVVDAAMELEGEEHIGPSKPMREFMDGLELRGRKQAFREQILAGHSNMKGLH